MTDREKRAVVLTDIHSRRQKVGLRPGNPGVFPDDPPQEYYRICEQLAEHGLIKGELVRTPLESGGWGVQSGLVEITGAGSNVVESDGETSPIPISFVSNTNNFSNCSSIQIGDHNSQEIVNGLLGLAKEVDQSEAGSAEKEEVKSLLRRVAEHQLTNTLLGAAAGALVQGLS